MARLEIETNHHSEIVFVELQQRLLTVLLDYGTELNKNIPNISQESAIEVTDFEEGSNKFIQNYGSIFIP
jgi:hypothetical protein